MQSASAWATDTEVNGVGPGIFRATLSSRWNAGSHPNGGYLMATGLKAVAAAVAHPDPLTATCHFMRPGEDGPAELAVDVVRVGRTVSTATATLSQSGRERIRILATFGDLSAQDGPSHLTLTPPDLPRPEDCVPARSSLPSRLRLPITEPVDIRFAPGGSVWGDAEPSGDASAAAWFRLRDGTPPDPFVAVLAVDAFIPAIQELGVRQWCPTLELTVHLRGRPAAGWLRVVRRTRALLGGHFEEDSEVWDDEGTLVAMARQLARVSAPD